MEQPSMCRTRSEAVLISAALCFTRFAPPLHQTTFSAGMTSGGVIALAQTHGAPEQRCRCGRAGCRFERG